jgi:predicted RNA binding protein YcfA (HicA-like mRNA interferase family)
VAYWKQTTSSTQNKNVIISSARKIHATKSEITESKTFKSRLYPRKAKGSHTVWKHPALPGVTVTISGKDGNDAKPYLVEEVQDALRKLERN